MVAPRSTVDRLDKPSAYYLGKVLSILPEAVHLQLNAYISRIKNANMAETEMTAMTERRRPKNRKIH
jgi:hypothetical protein